MSVNIFSQIAGERSMVRNCLVAASALMLAVLAGCSSVPSTSIKGPLTALPSAPPTKVVNSGAIYQPGEGDNLFEDRRPRRVGDTITVNLVENTQINRSYDNKQNQTGNATLSLPAPSILGYHNIVGGTSVAPTSSSNYENKTALTNNSIFTGTITLTVIKVLDNGDLDVAGQKQISVNNDSQYIRLAGVVSPKDIGADGTINSTQLADVRLESKRSSSVDEATVISLLSRFFLDVLPY